MPGILGFVARLSAILVSGFYLLQLPQLQPLLKSYCLHLAQNLAVLLRSYDTAIAFDGAIIYRNTFDYAVNVDISCSGLDIMLLLSAAIWAWPANWKSKLLGWVVAILLAFVLNAVRIVSLLYTRLLQDMHLFDFVHEQAWPWLLIFTANGFFFFWLYKNQPQQVAKA